MQYLCDHKLVSKITVADKSLPATASLHPTHKAYFDNKSLVEFKQADLSKDPHVDRVFKDATYTYVFNVCGETRFGLSEQDYKVKCVETAQKCAAAARKCPSVQKFVEVSTAQVYNPDKVPSDESGKLKPWTVQAKYRLLAEDALQQTAGLQWVILRPAIVYGMGDLTGLTPRISCAAVYKKLGEKMKFLWGKELKLSTVHVHDVCTAMWIAAT